MFPVIFLKDAVGTDDSVVLSTSDGITTLSMLVLILYITALLPWFPCLFAPTVMDSDAVYDIPFASVPVIVIVITPLGDTPDAILKVTPLVVFVLLLIVTFVGKLIEISLTLAIVSATPFTCFICRRKRATGIMYILYQQDFTARK